MAPRIDVIGLSASYRGRPALAEIDLTCPANRVTSLVGPPDSGKSTLLRCLNSLHLMTEGARMNGEVRLDGVPVYGPRADLTAVRRAIGMVAGRPALFPTLSIRGNVLAGHRLISRRRPRDSGVLVERSLRAAGLWDDVRTRLDRSGRGLSDEQARRLCLARTLAVGPGVLLFDEPCEGLEPEAAARLEGTIAGLAETYTVVVATADIGQAARISHLTAYLAADGPDRAGRLVHLEPRAGGVRPAGTGSPHAMT
jgi:phosphate transport system ATP-binding protein